MGRRVKVPTLKQCEKATGWAAATWRNNCFTVATAINAALKLDWDECYGFYCGPVADTHPRCDSPLHRHGWLLMPNGRVFDPTRFQFEMVEPYIYVGPDDEDYDRGMERSKAKLFDNFPPAFDPTQKQVTLALTDRVAVAIVRQMFPNFPTLSFNQLVSLANMGPRTLGRAAGPVYAAIAAAGHVAAIPLDYRAAVKGNYRGLTREADE